MNFNLSQTTPVSFNFKEPINNERNFGQQKNIIFLPIVIHMNKMWNYYLIQLMRKMMRHIIFLQILEIVRQYPITTLYPWMEMVTMKLFGKY